MLLRAAVVAAALCASAAPAHAQLYQADRWHTIETAHFRVHFGRGLEAEARRAALDAERAWAELSTELRAPRGKVDLVVADNVDYVNGYATPFPSNRIVIFTHPPIDAPTLRNYDDWSRLVITHELLHVFHLDRADGLWRAARTLFGRHPALFPNAYLPDWIVEGLAVYYESRVTGAGRLEGAQHYMITRSAAEAGRVPWLGELSRSTTRFPGGETVYAYGGQLFDYLARTRDPALIPRFVDATSKGVLPFSLNRRARKVFGVSLESAWRDWRDSLVRSAARPSDPLPGWRDLTTRGRYVEFPRWLGDTVIVHVASNGREVTSAYTVSLGGRMKRVGRRNGLDANSPLPDGSIVFAQPDYVSPFHFRTDLYVEQDGRQRRLTRGARLAHPDARPDGEIVAVQSIPASTRLARVSPDGHVRPITGASAEVQWGEPRWAPGGTLIAAVRVRRGGISELVVLDSAGSVVGVPVSTTAILSTPSWGPRGESLFYTSTASGSAQTYSVEWSRGNGRPVAQLLHSAASTGTFSPEVSPNGSLLAALSFRFDGFRVGVAPMLAAGRPASDSVRRARAGCSDCLIATDAAAGFSETVGPVRRYSPWRSLTPRYWEPRLESADGRGTSFGAATGGEDVVGRHLYGVEVMHNPDRSETEGLAAYQYAGFGQPFISLAARQEWDHFSIVDSAGSVVGDLGRRSRTAGITFSVLRPRVRRFASLALGAELETRTYGSDPDTLLGLLPPVFGHTRRYPSVHATASWSNTRRPPLAISREDGVALSTTVRQRWEAGDLRAASRSVVAVGAAFKSLDLPGFAHHVLAVRGAAGFADRRAISSFSAGGLSGGGVNVFGGFGLPEQRRTFGVRGFPPSAEQGTRALAGTIEYRAPLAAPSRRVRYVPLLFDRLSLAAFSDAGRAWCPASAAASQVCTPDRGGPWLASAGAELNLDAAVQHDYPARFRLGLALPVAGRSEGRARAASVYLTAGAGF